MPLKFRINLLLLFLLLSLETGCGTPFSYQPRHTTTYLPIANNAGIEILKGNDTREKSEQKGVRWDKSVESIVSTALIDELNHSKLFLRVLKIQNEQSTPSKDCSHAVSFSVKRLQLRNGATTGEVAGGAALGLLGLPGIFIAAGIPSKWESNVEIEFEVFDAIKNESVFKRNYTSTRSVTLNAYAGNSQQKQQSSEALEDVITQFVADIASLPLSSKLP